MAGKRVIINGKVVDLPEGITRISQLRQQEGIDEAEQLVQVKGASSKPLEEDDELEDNARVQVIPSVIKGSRRE